MICEKHKDWLKQEWLCPACERDKLAAQLDGARDANGRLVKRTLQSKPLEEKPPTIVCLCGSCRFKEAFIAALERETDGGKIVLTVGRYMAQPEQDLNPELRKRLDELHLRKIDLADEVLILNVGGYIGKSTRSELEYAREHGKTVRFLEPEKNEALHIGDRVGIASRNGSKDGVPGYGRVIAQVEERFYWVRPDDTDVTHPRMPLTFGRNELVKES